MILPSQVFGLIALLIMVAGVVAIAFLIINAVVKVKLAKYNSIQQDSQSAAKQDGIWPPAPSVMQFSEPTPARPSPTLPSCGVLPQRREGEE